MNFTSWIIIFFIIAALYLCYKYQKVDKIMTKKIIKKNNYKKIREDVSPHMYYSAGPFDEYIWNYPDQGGKSIKSQRSKYVGTY